MESSRTLASLKNVAAAWLGQLVSLICTFVVRMIFARYLEQDYLGMETLFSNVLTMLSLAELGIGSAIVFSLYKPLAEGDERTIKSIMRLFRRCYVSIGCVIGIAGLILAPNITIFIKEGTDIPYLNIYFLFFVFNTAISYFFSYKGLLLTADQKNYIVSLIRYGCQIALCAVQIVVLVLTGNYFLFLTCMLCATLTQNIITVIQANKRYPFLKEKDIEPIDKEILAGIKKNICGMVVHKLSSVVNAPVNTMVVSTILGLGPVAIYGNYLLVVNSLSRLVDQMFDSVVASIGNLSVTASKERQYEVFQTTHFVNAFLYGPLCACFLALVTPFIHMTFGENYLFPLSVAVFFAVLFFFRGMRDAALSFVSANGLFWQTRIKAIIEVIVLILTVPVATYFFGIEGMLAANIFVQICISMLMEGIIVHKYALDARSPVAYFVKTAQYTLATLVICVPCFLAVQLLPDVALLRFLVGGVLCVLMSFGGFALFFHRSREFNEAKGIIMSFIRSRLKK